MFSYIFGFITTISNYNINIYQLVEYYLLKVIIIIFTHNLNQQQEYTNIFIYFNFVKNKQIHFYL